MAGPTDATGIMHEALLIDVTPRGLGVATAGGFCDPFIERNENIPTERKRIFTTSQDNQNSVRIKVMEGESRRSEENNLLGELVLDNLRLAPRGDVRIEVTFEVDTNGILNVSAVDQETHQRQSARLNLSGGMDNDEIARLAARNRDTEVLGDMPDILP